MNFIKLYIGDYLRDTGTLTLAQHGAYMLMLLEHYATEKPLPTGRELHRLLRADSKAERDAIDFIAAKFWTLTDAGLTNNRADKEIERAANQRSINQEIGKRGGRPKRTEQITESVSETDSERIPNRNPSQTPDTRHQKNPEAARTDANTIPAPAETVRAAPPDPFPKPDSAPTAPVPVEPSTRRGVVAAHLRSLGITCTYAHPTVCEWAAKGVTDEQLREAVEVARMRKPPPEPIPIAYLIPIVRELHDRPVDAGGSRERDWAYIFGETDTRATA